MDPIFTEEQLNRMSSKDMRSLLKIMMQHQQKQEETLQKQETRIQLLEEQKKELEFLNAMLSNRLTLAQKKRFGASSEKYAEGYTQMNLFNEAEQEADPMLWSSVFVTLVAKKYRFMQFELDMVFDTH